MERELHLSLNYLPLTIEGVAFMNQSETCKKKILVVEDEPIVGRLCTRILAAEGFDVDVVNNGLSAKEVAIGSDYNLCISDIKLPGITGIQLYEQ